MLDFQLQQLITATNYRMADNYFGRYAPISRERNDSIQEYTSNLIEHTSMTRCKSQNYNTQLSMNEMKMNLIHVEFQTQVKER